MQKIRIRYRVSQTQRGLRLTRRFSFDAAQGKISLAKVTSSLGMAPPKHQVMSKAQFLGLAAPLANPSLGFTKSQRDLCSELQGSEKP